jgi:hypothetical protein
MSAAVFTTHKFPSPAKFFVFRHKWASPHPAQGANISCMRNGRYSSSLLKQRPRAGQTMLEYLMVAGILLACVSILAVFLYTFKEHGGRILDLAASEFP